MNIESRLKVKGLKIFFGAGIGGEDLLSHTPVMPDFYIDNDIKKHGKKISGYEIFSPDILKKINYDEISFILITSGAVSEIRPQLKDLGIPYEKIIIPPKSWMGKSCFNKLENRIKAAKNIFNLFEAFPHASMVSVGGTALGFCRENDFIHWDDDIDLFSSINSRDEILNYFLSSSFVEKNSVYFEEYLGDERGIIICNIILSNSESVPLGIKFYDPNKKLFKDIFEDYIWNWPMEMFTKPTTKLIHGYKLKVPNPFEKYLEGIYGEKWDIPNKEFCYDDYSK